MNTSYLQIAKIFRYTNYISAIFVCFLSSILSFSVPALECRNDLPNAIEVKNGLKNNIVLPEGLPKIEAKANEGIPIMQYALAGLYEHGLGVEKDSTIAFQWYNKAANQGLKVAQFQLGLFHLFCSKRDVDKSIQWFLRAYADNDYPESRFYLSYIAIHHGPNQKVREEGITVVMSMAEQKLPLAMIELSHLKRYGKFVNKDAESSFSIMNELANKGYKPALFELASYYREGIGVEKDARKYLEMLTRAAKVGDPRAKIELMKHKESE